MAQFDVLIRGGQIVDGSGNPSSVGDIGIVGARIAAMGDLGLATARRTIDATGQIVAPGVIDVHTHYDAQIFWDPYIRSSGWHGTTTAIMSNCGFGFAPVRPTAQMRERYMRMMENTEQLSYKAMAEALAWNWSTFPEWMAALRATPKGVNIATYLPMNALLSFVIGPDEAKTRPATAAERQRMRALLHEAMDAGARGFSFSFLGPKENGHVDFDFSPMPSDVMDEEEAYNLARVLRERGDGVVQMLTEFLGVDPAVAARGRLVAERLAEISGRPIMHGVISPGPGHPEMHRSALAWLDEMTAKRHQIFSQAFCFRSWVQIRVTEFNLWDGMPIWREFSKATPAEKRAMVAPGSDYRDRLRDQYDRVAMLGAGGALEEYLFVDAPPSSAYARDLARRLGPVAVERGLAITDLFLDILHETDLAAEFSVVVTSDEPEYTMEMLRHPRVIAGLSDGGAHSKTLSGGYWSTDLISWLVVERGLMPVEEIHHLVSARPAQVAGLTDRGVLKVGAFADLMIYDLAALGYEFGRYETITGLPGGDWARTVRPRGISAILVNGVVTHEAGIASGAHPGLLLDRGGEAGGHTRIPAANAA